MFPGGAAPFLERLRYSRKFQLFRYTAADVCVALGYSTSVFLFVDILHLMTPMLASAASFVLWVPVSYLFHRDFTFRSDDRTLKIAIRFCSASVVRFIASLLVIYLFMMILHLNYIYGVLANWIVLPLLNYFILETCVFTAAPEPLTSCHRTACTRLRTHNQ